MTDMKRPHCAGADHVVPLEGTAGHARVVARGCRVEQPSGYFAESDSAECGHGYTWDCGSCPALPERVLFRLQDERHTDPLRVEVPHA